MMTGGAEAIFLDTNVLVYASTIRAPLHQVAQQAIQQFYDSGRNIWISRQILREYLVTLSRPQAFTNPLPIETLTTEINRFQTRFQIAEDSPQVTERLLVLMAEIAIGGKQVHDANIVATMQVYGINELLTHNTVDFDRFSEVITVLPLVKN
jgi:predicted nucleic acid-binding protein